MNVVQRVEKLTVQISTIKNYCIPHLYLEHLIIRLVLFMLFVETTNTLKLHHKSILLKFYNSVFLFPLDLLSDIAIACCPVHVKKGKK